jgi:hypothetical protein
MRSLAADVDIRIAQLGDDVVDRIVATTGMRGT